VGDGDLAQCQGPPDVLAWNIKVPSISLLAGPEGQFRTQQAELLDSGPSPNHTMVMCRGHFVPAVALLDLPASALPNRKAFDPPTAGKKGTGT
jgi:hypothetical protein